MDLMSEKMVNLNRKMQTIKKNQMKISQFKMTISEMKILKKLKTGNCRRVSELEHRSTESIPTEKQKKKLSFGDLTELQNT